MSVVRLLQPIRSQIEHAAARGAAWLALRVDSCGTTSSPLEASGSSLAVRPIALDARRFPEGRWARRFPWTHRSAAGHIVVQQQRNRAPPADSSRRLVTWLDGASRAALSRNRVASAMQLRRSSALSSGLAPANRLRHASLGQTCRSVGRRTLLATMQVTSAEAEAVKASQLLAPSLAEEATQQLDRHTNTTDIAQPKPRDGCRPRKLPIDRVSLGEEIARRTLPRSSS